jgi:hypothetical protein
MDLTQLSIGCCSQPCSTQRPVPRRIDPRSRPVEKKQTIVGDGETRTTETRTFDPPLLSGFIDAGRIELVRTRPYACAFGGG